MTLSKAIEILEAHNKWRRGMSCRKVAMNSPAEISIAIDVVIAHYKEQEEL